MMPLRPTFLAQQIRIILNNWPSYAHVKPRVRPAVLAKHVPEPFDNYDSKGAAIIAADREASALESLRDKQAYLQSLDKPA